jgi:hydrogenase nickel incorporation protein HypA/HybF
MSYCEGVLDAVERRAAGRAVARVGVRIGAVHRVVADAFEQSFRLAAAGGPAENATTELVVVPVHGHCMDCRSDFESPDPSPACPSCGSLEVAVEGGDEVVLEWLQYAGPAPGATTGDRADELVPAHTHHTSPEGS